MATSLNAFLPEVSLNAEGLADIVAINYLRNAAIKFCNLTRYVTETLDSETVGAGEPELDVFVSSTEDIVAIESVYVDGVPIDPISEEELKVSHGAWKEATGSKVTKFLSYGKTIRLYPIPDNDVSVDVTVSKRPSVTATSVDDSLLQEWKDAVVYGALSYICMIPNKPFTNVQMASAYSQVFNDGVVSAQAKSFKQINRASLRVEPA